MPKEPKPNFASFTKAELVKTVKKLDTRQTKLLNRIAELEHKLFVAIFSSAANRQDARAVRRGARHPGPVGAPAGDLPFPWEKD